MEHNGLNDIRKAFRDFYVSKGHYAEKSASLIPQDDNSLLIINSGMAPLKKYFSGTETPPAKRMTTCQKCMVANLHGLEGEAVVTAILRWQNDQGMRMQIGRAHV